MSTSGLTFGLVVAFPAIMLAALALSASVPGEWGRRALVVYGGMLSVLFGTLSRGGEDGVLPVLASLAAGFAAAAASGRAGLTLAAAALGVLAAYAGWSGAISPWGPALAAVALSCALVGSLVGGRF